MLFKYFRDKHTELSVAVNPQNVTMVTEISQGGSRIYFSDPNYRLDVYENILEVASRLSEK